MRRHGVVAWEEPLKVLGGRACGVFVDAVQAGCAEAVCLFTRPPANARVSELNCCRTIDAVSLKRPPTVSQQAYQGGLYTRRSVLDDKNEPPVTGGCATPQRPPIHTHSRCCRRLRGTKRERMSKAYFFDGGASSDSSDFIKCSFTFFNFSTWVRGRAGAHTAREGHG